MSSACSFGTTTIMPTPQLKTRSSSSSGSSAWLWIQAYTPGNFYRDIESQWDPAVANFVTGIGALIVATTSSQFGFATTFDPKIQKTDIHRVIIMGRREWGRH